VNVSSAHISADLGVDLVREVSTNLNYRVTPSEASGTPIDAYSARQARSRRALCAAAAHGSVLRHHHPQGRGAATEHLTPLDVFKIFCRLDVARDEARDRLFQGHSREVRAEAVVNPGSE
jgi:hypothetical protein